MAEAKGKRVSIQEAQKIIAGIKPSEKFLTSKKEIQLFLKNATDHMFKKYIKAGMPARYEDGRWCASTTKIEQWWEVYTSISMMNVIDRIPDDEDDTKNENSNRVL